MQRPGETGTSASIEPLKRKLAALAHLSGEELNLIAALDAKRNSHAPSTEIYGESHLMGRPRAILSGWACRARMLSDGRRQIIGFLVPGDLVGVCRRHNPLALCATQALTGLETADAQPLLDVACDGVSPHEGLQEALAVSASLEEASLLDQVTRLGRQTAYERTAHLMLELRWRLALVGLADERSFPLPLTQEVLADALGLSIVHVNRTLQQLRRDGLIEWRNGRVDLLKPDMLAATSDFRPPHPTAKPISASVPRNAATL